MLVDPPPPMELEALSHLMVSAALLVSAALPPHTDLLALRALWVFVVLLALRAPWVYVVLLVPRAFVVPLVSRVFVVRPLLTAHLVLWLLVVSVALLALRALSVFVVPLVSLALLAFRVSEDLLLPMVLLPLTDLRVFAAPLASKASEAQPLPTVLPVLLVLMAPLLSATVSSLSPSTLFRARRKLLLTSSAEERAGFRMRLNLRLLNLRLRMNFQVLISSEPLLIRSSKSPLP